jgi:Fic family protein
MVTQAEKLAQSLEHLQDFQKKGRVAIRSRDFTRTHLNRLIKNGFLKEVIKGWYIACRPDEIQGDSTSWYVSFWHFCACYLKERFGNAWCLSPEQSLLLHAENWTVPNQLLVRSKKGNNKITPLPFDTSLLDLRYTMPEAKEIEEKQGLQLFAIVPALLTCSPSFFVQYPTDARTVLAMIQDASVILPALLEGGHSTIAGRLVSAFRNTGQDRIAEEIKKTMSAAGYMIREQDPFVFEIKLPFLDRKVSPYVNRLHILWREMRKPILERFPKPSENLIDLEQYLRNVEEKYITDAYHSLSIEGYQVSTELIQKVRSGQWDPDHSDTDYDHKNALAARGYWQAFQATKQSIRKVLMGANPGKVISEEHGDWFRELFGPSVIAGILKPAALAGYRRHSVFIRRSMHVPPNFTAVPDLMHAFFDLLANETEASVRIVLGHFFFVFIHPYMDGNGRIGRFLMNVMFASGQYPWTIVPVERRQQYMKTLEEASVNQNIIPFCDFLAECCINLQLL